MTFILVLSIICIIIFLAFKWERKCEIQVRHGGNQNIPEFYYPDGRIGKYITLYLSKNKTIKDVKLELINHIKVKKGKLRPTFPLRLTPFDCDLRDECSLWQLPSENGIYELFINIPGW